jgi:cystathionine beta-synthase
VTDKEALNMTRSLLKKEGIYSGPSSGAAVIGAIKYASKLSKPEKILILLPDSGNRYLSKVFNDDWMRENRMLDEESHGTIQDLLHAKRKREVIAVTPEESAESVIRKMRTHGISQFPVVRGEHLIGIIGESDLLHPFFEGKVRAEDRIEPLVRKDPPRLDPDASIERLSEIFESSSCCVVLRQAQVIGVLTKIDLITFLAERMRKEGAHG